MVTLLAIVISRLKMPPIISSPCRRAFETLPHYSPFFWAPPIIIKPILCVLVLRKARGLLRARTGLSALLARGRLVYFFAVFADLLSILVPWLTDPLNTVFLPLGHSPSRRYWATVSCSIYASIWNLEAGRCRDVDVFGYPIQAGDAVPDGSNAPAVTGSASRV
ncbi:hypothetical protein EDD16DRAFT_1677489 [Pisolithus croceorrhizus]|nr:hypothetical protein EDD16DRAFT_1677489 [Pisolithus croceorrhizus]